MISVIICSRKPGLLANITHNIEQTIGTSYEIIAIDNSQNKYSISQAYNKGAQLSKYDHLCFVHEDVLFHTINWGEILFSHFAAKDIALIGILGCTIKTSAPSGVYIPLQNLNRINQLQKRRDNGVDRYLQNPFNELHSEVATLDGMFLATTKANHQQYPFDEAMLTGFHGYDIDYSLGQAAHGKVVVIYDILIEHLSYGGNTRAWIDAQLKITKKWKSQLPKHILLDKATIIQAETTNLGIFLDALSINRYKMSVSIKYLLQLFQLRPFDWRNIRFTIKIIYRYLRKR